MKGKEERRMGFYFEEFNEGPQLGCFREVGDHDGAGGNDPPRTCGGGNCGCQGIETGP